MEGEYILGRFNHMNKLQKTIGDIHRKRTASSQLAGMCVISEKVD